MTDDSWWNLSFCRCFKVIYTQKNEDFDPISSKAHRNTSNERRVFQLQLWLLAWGNSEMLTHIQMNSVRKLLAVTKTVLCEKETSTSRILVLGGGNTHISFLRAGWILLCRSELSNSRLLKHGMPVIIVLWCLMYPTVTLQSNLKIWSTSTQKPPRNMSKT